MKSTETVRAIFCHNHYQDEPLYYLQETDKTHRPNIDKPAFEFPGGKVGKGQNLVETLLEEAKEEVGIDLRNEFTDIQLASFYVALIERNKIHYETGADTNCKFIVHVYLIYISQILANQFTAIGLPEDRLTGNSKWINKTGLIELANIEPINSITASKLLEIL